MHGRLGARTAGGAALGADESQADGPPTCHWCTVLWELQDLGFRRCGSCLAGLLWRAIDSISVDL